jgi:hypothetical protein
MTEAYDPNTQQRFIEAEAYGRSGDKTQSLL